MAVQMFSLTTEFDTQFRKSIFLALAMLELDISFLHILGIQCQQDLVFSVKLQFK